MSRFEIITNQQEWSATLEQFQQWDFFHTHRYHCSRVDAEGSSPWMITIVDQGEVQFALPMIRRELPNGVFDLVSVYGYSGPLVKEADVLAGQLELVKAELERIGCVSLFCRMHPVLHEAVEPSSDIIDSGKTIAILCGSEEERFAGYRKTTRYEVRKLHRLGAEVTFEDSENAFDTFVDIYNETMTALNATPFYFFDVPFLKSLFEIGGVKTVIGSVRYEGEIISSGLFTSVGDIAQYFLGGARMAHSKLAPQKLLLHRATEWAAEQNAKMLHLGGGRGSQEDGLFRFKAGFSSRVFPFRLLKMILNQQVYDDLIEVHAKLGGGTANELVETGFFPAYRAPVTEKS